MRKAMARAPRSANSWSWLQPTAPLFDVAQPSPCCRVVSCKASTSSYSQAQERPRCVWLWLLPRGAPLVVVHVTGRLLCPLASACNQVTGFYASVFTTLYFVADMTSGAIVKASMRCPRGALLVWRHEGDRVCVSCRATTTLPRAQWSHPAALSSLWSILAWWSPATTSMPTTCRRSSLSMTVGGRTVALAALPAWPEPYDGAVLHEHATGASMPGIVALLATTSAAAVVVCVWRW